MDFITQLPYVVKFASIAIFLIAAACLAGKAAAEFGGATGGDRGKWARFFAFRPVSAPGFTPLPPLRLMRYVLGLFLVTRLLLFTAVYSFAAVTDKLKPTVFQTFADLWNKYDSLHYLSIAQYGYRTAGAERLSLVFYPLYPALVRLFHSVVPDYFLAGMVVSNLSLLVALYFLVRLAEVEWQNTEAAHASAMYAVVFPFSFFFSIVYTESVFVMLCILSFYCLRKNKWLAAGFFGMLAALTRNQGLLLAIPIAIEATAALPAVGIFLYLCINKWVSGDWFRFLSYQREHWQQRIGFFADNLYDTVYRTIYWHSPPYALGIWIPEAVLFFASFALLIYMTNKTRLAQRGTVRRRLVHPVLVYGPCLPKPAARRTDVSPGEPAVSASVLFGAVQSGIRFLNQARRGKTQAVNPFFRGSYKNARMRKSNTK